VTTINRGKTALDVSGVELLRADRTDHDALASLVRQRRFDLVVDTWSGAPLHATAAARLLADRVGKYVYISSRSVYTWPIAAAANESHATVQSDPESPDETDYAKRKRGGELGVLSVQPDALIARAGLILGPYENVGRLPWWLLRLARGGLVPAPGPSDRPLQFIDARDLALWVLDASSRNVSGVFDAVSQPGHTHMGELLSEAVAVTGNRSELVWVTPESIEAAGVAPWTNLPIWLPPTGDVAALHNSDASAAKQAGLRCRPIAATIADTWAWLSAIDPNELAARLPGLAMHGLSAEQEAVLLSASGESSQQSSQH
jgi:2'-hydroxyisoflavone reductase